MRVVYFDCFAGVSGDMIIGALIDLGVDLDALKQALSSLGLDRYEINSLPVQRSSIAATKFNVDVDHSAQPARTLADVSSMIAGSNLPDQSKARAIRVFERLAESEARVHRTTPDKVHFHEVGAVDSIIDIVGAMIGFELLGIERFFCSPLRVGSGLVNSQHGQLPVPAPATAELLRGIPMYAGEIEGEFVTPTGAAIVATICEQFGAMPQLNVTRIGYGAGSRDPKHFPNALRLMMGEMVDPKNGFDGTSEEDGEGNAGVRGEEIIVVVETNIDDMNPQVYGFVMERAFARGALDVFMASVQMKKDRPGVLLTVLCRPEKVEAMIEMLFVETTTLGVRYYEAKRRVLERSIEEIETPYGLVRIKVARNGARTLHFQPEYDDCARIAVDTNTPLLEVQAAAIAAYRKNACK